LEDIEVNLLVWKELKGHLNNDTESAAEDFVRVLIEHGAEAEDIAKYAVDSEVKRALMEYIEVDDDSDEFHEDNDTDEYEF